MAKTAPIVGAVIVHYEYRLYETHEQPWHCHTILLCQSTLPPNDFQLHSDDAAKYHNDANFYNPSRLLITDNFQYYILYTIVLHYSNRCENE